ncbi:MAG TPA: hypothetical protein VJ870_05090 [Amycolatopsis sp.]|nr:hypothetical protein [Amycolatopsis sp.]
MRFFTATGERRGEALGTHWSDFDPDAQTMTMTGNIVQVRGKGTVRNRGKSETSNRTIALPAWSVERLKEREAKVGAVDPDKPVDRSADRGRAGAVAPVDDAQQLRGPGSDVTGERGRSRLCGHQTATAKTGDKSATGFGGSLGVGRADSRKPAVTSGFSVLLSQPDVRPKGFEPLTF